MMKKVFGIVIAMIGIIVAAFAIDMKQKEAYAISIIGGADGPTSVFLAGKVGSSTSAGILVVGVVILVVGIILLLKKKK